MNLWLHWKHKLHMLRVLSIRLHFPGRNWSTAFVPIKCKVCWAAVACVMCQVQDTQPGSRESYCLCSMPGYEQLQQLAYEAYLFSHKAEETSQCHVIHWIAWGCTQKGFIAKSRGSSKLSSLLLLRLLLFLSLSSSSSLLISLLACVQSEVLRQLQINDSGMIQILHPDGLKWCCSSCPKMH